MKYKNLKRRFLSILTLLAILLPIISLCAYAETSDRENFNFVFNGGTGSQSVAAKKRDLGESSEGSGAVTVNNMVLSVGRVEFWVNSPQNKTITLSSLYMDSTGTGSLYYDTDELDKFANPATFKMYAAPIGTVWICAGVFQP